MNERFLYHWAKKNVRNTVVERDSKKAFDLGLWNSVGHLGFFNSIAASQSNNPMPLDTFVKNFYDLSSGSLDLPLMVSMGAQAGVVSYALSKAKLNPTLKKYLNDITSNHKIVGLATYEYGASIDLRKIKSTISHSNGVATLNSFKPLGTNIGVANYILFVANTLDGMTLALVPNHPALEQKNVALAGFWTGLTGSVTATDLSIPEGCILDNNSAETLSLIYDMERLLIPVIICGMLHEFTCTATIDLSNLGQNQYIQDKLVRLFHCHRVLNSLIEANLAQFNAKGKFKTEDLSILKLEATEMGAECAALLLELYAGKGYQSGHFAEKFFRDVAALKSLGGTKEQHKINIFRSIQRLALNSTPQKTEMPQNEKSATLV